MYGDCQVMSTMGVPSENLLMQNPNFNFMPFHPFPSVIPKEENNGLVMRGGKELEMESGSGSEQVEDKSGNELESGGEQQPPNKKKCYHRHTARQIQEMESMFKECPHPDDKQRMKLSQDLGLKPRQVKFWFQNRRTQMKAQQDRSDNVILRAENDSLKNENYRLHAELRNVICPNCEGAAILGGISFEDIRLENARLREELERVCCVASRYSGRPIQVMTPAPTLMPPSLELDMNIYSRHFSEPTGSCTEMMPMQMMPETCSFPESGLILMEEDKSLAMELSISFMNQLVKMCQASEPLWIRNKENGKEVLNLEEHARLFQWPLNLKQHSSEFRTEATRDSAVVIMNSITLVDTFLDANKWMELFPSIVARAKTVQVIASGVSGASGSLHLAIWVEHAEVEEKPVHQIFSHFVYSGMAFGARRWLAVLQRQCERVASLMARNIADLGVIPSPEARKNLMRLAQRMIRTFCVNMSTCSGQSWTALSDSAVDTVRITTRKVSEPGQPNGVILCAVSTTWLPFPHYQVFDFLRDERRRSQQLDVLSNGNSLHEVAHIANGSHPGNCISLLRINVASNSSQHVELMLQESCTDQSGSHVVYTTIDVDSIQLAMNGEDPSCIPLLPLGFVIVPVEHINETTSGEANLISQDSNSRNSGCLLTVGLQVLASTMPSAKINLSSVTAINNHLCNTVHQISAAINNGTGTNCPDNGSVIVSCNGPNGALKQ
ncbi:hypothetical protein LWI28_025822 [Acer negundo]|uniref:Uncharacterized protein n=1 Tax=Acer negundo TaxID=4023 RepID=A0AAD5J1Q4_ACENE|nr:hypothetical protein LWI28_025822 [Acer negundo]